MPSSPNSTSPATIEQMVNALKPFPPAAHVLARLQSLLSDANSGMDDIAELIRLDSALTARVIRISNSILFRRGLPCSTIEEAVNRVGFREVYRVVAVLASDAIVAKQLPAYGREAIAMWRESVACACACEVLAERLGEDMPIAYMSGLLHATGRLPINNYLTSPAGAHQRLAEEPFPREHSGAEFALFGFTQAAAGAFLLGKWNFTPTTIQPILHQYDPLAAEEPHDRMAAVLYAARLLRTIVCQNTSTKHLTIDEEVFALVRLSLDDVLEHLQPVREQLARAEQMTKA